MRRKVTKTRRKPRKAARREASSRRYPREGLATISEASEFLRIARSTLYEHLKKGRLKADAPLGTRKRFSWQYLWSLVSRKD